MYSCTANSSLFVVIMLPFPECRPELLAAACIDPPLGPSLGRLPVFLEEFNSLLTHLCDHTYRCRPLSPPPRQHSYIFMNSHTALAHVVWVIIGLGYCFQCTCRRVDADFTAWNFYHLSLSSCHECLCQGFVVHLQYVFLLLFLILFFLACLPGLA